MIQHKKHNNEKINFIFDKAYNNTLFIFNNKSNNSNNIDILFKS